MEAVPRLPMISFELRTSDEKPNFALKLKNYIQNFYSEDGESFSNQINQLDGLRASASRPVTDVSGCASLKRYYCQLNFMMTRFPMDRDGEAAVKFSWKDPYNDTVLVGPDINIELACVLYNIGALHSQLGAADNRTSADGMKMACTHFQCAAWAFQQILDQHAEMHYLDGWTDLLQYMNSICLAQAQECILEKSMLDNRKSTIIAKLAVQTVEYYRQALKRLGAFEAANIEMSSKLRKKWEMYLKFKISYHSSIGLLYQGQQAEEEQKSGERVAYYDYALEKLLEARKLSKNLDHIEAVNEALQFTQDVVEGKLKAAKSENEFVYHEQVPDVSSLPELKGASLVKGIGFSVNDPEVSGPDIFAKLIPIKAHETSSIYSEQLAELLRNITTQVAQADHDLASFLSTVELGNPIRSSHDMPQELIDCCAALSAKPDAVDELQSALAILSETYRDVELMLTEIRTLLEQEEKEALRYEDIVGKRPPSIVATDLTREAKKYWDAHNKASESNNTLRNAIQMHSENLQLLMLPPRQLERKIPSVAVDDAEDETIFNQMDALANKIDEMRSQRNMLVNQLREAINRDDITHKVVTFTGESKADLFEQEKAKHQTLVNHIRMNVAAQEKIIAAVQELYPRFTMSRRKVAAKLHSRSAIIQSLIAAYEAYDDLIAKSRKGIDFYQKLQMSASKLLQRVKSTCTVQQEERAHILSSIRDSPKSLEKTEKKSFTYLHNIDHDAPPSSNSLKLKDYLNLQKETGKLSLVSAQPPATWVPGIRPAPVGSEGNDPVTTIPFDPANIPYYHPPPNPSPATPAYPTQAYYNPTNPTYDYTPYVENLPQSYTVNPPQPTYPPYTDGSSMTYPTNYTTANYTPYYNYAPEPVASPAPAVTPTATAASTIPPQNESTVAYPYMQQEYTPYGNNYYPYQPGSDYTPQQYPTTGFQHGAEYMQYGNTTLYTQTQQQTPYTPTSSQVYSDYMQPQMQQPSTQSWSAYSYSDGQPGNNVATYQQADGYPRTSLTSSSSANGIMASPSVASSNIDLLAGLDFEVSQKPLTASPIQNDPTPAPEPQITPKIEQPTVVDPKPTTSSTPPIKQPVEEKLDVDSLKTLAPDVEKLEKFVEGLTLKTLSGPTLLDLKWKEIMDLQEKDSHTRSISVARCYPMKNRFPDILPYDDSRIELPSTKDDYINASLVKPVTSSLTPVILTQAPLPVTYGDFWTMVMEQQTELIVCLLSDAELNELGGHIYWPENKTQDFTSGKMRISLQACNPRQHWVERILSVTALDTKITRVVVHLQFTAWPSSMFPVSPAPLLIFLREVRVFMQQQRNASHPAIIHCLSGVGRSGLALLLLAAMSDIQAARGLPDLVALVSRISSSRKNSLRDREHLKFAYQSVLYYAQDLLFQHGILTSRTSFEENKTPKSGEKCHTRHPSQDFLVAMNELQSKVENLSVMPDKSADADSDEKKSNQPASLLAALDPNQFNLSSSETKPSRSKMKFTPDQFTKPSVSLASQQINSDPLSSLDPLWSLKK